MMKPENAIELKNITKSFSIGNTENRKKNLFSPSPKKRKLLFDDLSLSVKKGEILGIVGRNGSGKSTLLSIAAKILEPDSGTVEVAGRAISALELSMGFQQDMTGRDNIIIKGEMYGMSKKQIELIIEEIIEYSGIGEYIDNPLRTYSSGMRSRLAFSIMVFTNIGILIADEVLTTGDLGFSIKARETFKQFLNDGKTVLFVSHNTSSIVELCTRAIWLENGRIMKDGKPRYVCAEYERAIAESYDIIKELAESGVSEAQYKLSIMYRDGTNVSQNRGMYLDWLSKSANNGFVPAQICLADELNNSEREEDKSLAIHYYQIASRSGDASASLKLSAILGKTNNSLERTFLINFFYSLAELGNPTDMAAYANLLLTTAWSDDERKESFKWFLKAAECGSPDSMYQVAIMCRDGIGTSKSFENFEYWIEKSANLGHQKSIFLLADSYLSGKIIDRDEHKGLQLYLKLAKNGIPKAQFMVAKLYRDGIGCEPDLDNSDYWFSIYSKSILAPFQILASSMIDINVIETDTSSFDLIKAASESFNQSALFQLAERYATGKGVERDEDVMWALYDGVTELLGKNVLNVANMAFTGKTTGVDYERAGKLYSRMAYSGNPKVLYRLYVLYKMGKIPLEKD